MVVVSASAVVVVTIIVSLLFIAMLYNNFTEQLSNYKGKTVCSTINIMNSTITIMQKDLMESSMWTSQNTIL